MACGGGQQFVPGLAVAEIAQRKDRQQPLGAVAMAQQAPDQHVATQAPGDLVQPVGGLASQRLLQVVPELEEAEVVARLQHRQLTRRRVHQYIHQDGAPEGGEL